MKSVYQDIYNMNIKHITNTFCRKHNTVPATIAATNIERINTKAQSKQYIKDTRTPFKNYRNYNHKKNNPSNRTTIRLSLIINFNWL